MRKYNKGDVVICVKYEVDRKLVWSSSMMWISTPYIEDCFFNRKAVISGTYKEIMEKETGVEHEDKDEYQIRFLDNDSTLSWVTGDELILLLPFEVGGKRK